MPRRIRVIIPGIAVHVIHRGRGRLPCFFFEDDYLHYLSLLRNCALPHGCIIHAYALMPSHVHLLLTPLAKTSVSAMMKTVGQRYTRYANTSYRRQGSLWESRFRACLVQSGNHVLLCQKYIELNPVRNGLVHDPGAYPWTSYRIYRYGEQSDVVIPHPDYRNLGQTDQDRQEAYGEFFLASLAVEVEQHITEITNGCSLFGDDSFVSDFTSVVQRQ